MTCKFRREWFLPLALAMVLLPMLGNALYYWFELPLKPGEVIGTFDPDPWLRLTLVRDWMLSGDWYSHHVWRSDAPFGQTISPWTRPLDIVIRFLTELQPASVDLTLRLVRSALLLPSLWMGLLLLGIVRIARRITSLPTVPLYVSALVYSMLLMWNYFGQANADHHSMLAALFIWAIGSILLKPTLAIRDLISCGLLFTLQLWVSPEALVLIGATYGWFGLRWLAGDKLAMRQLAQLSSVITLASATALMVERPETEWFVAVYDSISIVYVYVLALVALLAWWMHLFPAPTRRERVALATVCFAFGLFAVWQEYPLFFQGPLAAVDPFILSDFLPRVNEVKHAYLQPTFDVLELVIYPLILLLTGLMLWRNQPALLSRSQCKEFGYFLIVTFALYLAQVRFHYYFLPLVCVFLAPFIAAILTPNANEVRNLWPCRSLCTLSPTRQSHYRLPFLLAVFALSPALLYIGATNAPASKKVARCIKTSYVLIENTGLRDLGRGKPVTLYAPTDLGTSILFWTPHRIVASNYHREGQGLKFVWDAEKITNPDALRRHLAKRKVDALLLCPSGDMPDDSVLARLQQGKLKLNWLTPVTYTLPPPPTKEAEDKPIEGSTPALFLIKK